MVPKNSLKILFLTKWFPNRNDYQDGVFIQKHAKAVSLYCNVFVLHFQPDPSLKKSYEITDRHTENNREVIVYYRQNQSSFIFLRKGVNLLRYLSAVKKGLKYLRQKNFNPDLVHVHVLLRPVVIAYFLKITRGWHFIISEHWTGFATGVYRKKHALVKWFYRYFARQAECMITVSENLRDRLKAYGFQNRFYVVPNVVENVQPDFRNGDGKVKLLNISDLDDQKKNISDLINVFREVVKQYPNAELHIIGGGYDEPQLKQLAEYTGLLNKQLFMYGRKDNRFVYDFFKEIDFLVVNSNFETFSVATAEALLHGKPVVVTRCGGPEEFVTEDAGVVIEKNNPEQLRKALSYMIENYYKYDAKKLHEYALSKFSHEQVGKKINAIYKTIPGAAENR